MKKVTTKQTPPKANFLKRSSSGIKQVATAVWDFINRHLWLQILLSTVLIFLVTVFVLGISFSFKHRNDPLQIGVSFSQKYAQELGNDWRQNFTAVVQDINFEKVRLMSYWDIHEPEQGVFDFTDLDWQMDEAAVNNTDVSLAIGLRQPRWPECHYPSWARDLELQTSQRALLVYIEEVVTRYKDHPALESYQLENEVANRHFGDCPEYDREFYAEEFDLVRSLDSDNLLITNVSNQSGFQIKSPVGDKVGFSIYQRAHFPAFDRQVPWSFWYVPSWWHGMRAMSVELIHGADAFIHELQAEPWGPKATVDLSTKEQFQTMDPDKFIEITNYAEATGMKEYYLWGAEWWYWLKVQHNEPAMWDIVDAKVQSTKVQ